MLLWLYFVTGWVLCLGLAPVLSRRYWPGKAWAWIVLIFFTSWAGLGLYLLLGENPLQRRRRARYRQVAHEVERRGRLRSLDPHIVDAPAAEPFTGIERLAVGGGSLRAVGGNHVELIGDLNAFIDRLVEDIDRAEHHAHLMFYIYRDDAAGRRVADALAAAARRGVKCRLVVDAHGARPIYDHIEPRLRARGVEVRAVMPLNPFRGRLIRPDVRNHHKIVVIDGRIGYTGSGNITEDHYGKELGKYHELMVRLRGPIVTQLQIGFFEDWCRKPAEAPDDDDLFPAPECAGPSVAQLVPSGPTYPHAPLRDVAIAIIHSARQRVTLTTPYLVPDETFVTALRLAVARGVRVDLIHPSQSDSALAIAAARSYIADLLAMGVRVHLRHDGLLHAKVLTADRAIAMIGSGNLDIRSFRLNAELNLLLYSQPDIDALIDVQERYIDKSEALDDTWPRSRPLARRVADDLAKLLSPLL